MSGTPALADPSLFQSAEGVSLTSSASSETSTGNHRLSGFVYVDRNRNGLRDAVEPGVPGVQITLTGSDTSGNALHRTVLTTDSGSYAFDQLPAGNYQISERQPAAMSDGLDSTTIPNAIAGNDIIQNIVLSGGQRFAENNFGETHLLPRYVGIVWHFSSAHSAALFRETIARAEEMNGNFALAAAIRAGRLDGPEDDNSRPVAVNDAYSVARNQVLAVNAAAGVLANDTDPDGDLLTAQLDTAPASGSLTLRADGSFTYTPATGFSGSDSFRYRATDGHLVSNVATATITVTGGIAGVNVAPVAVADSYTVARNQALTVTAATGVLANDTDADGDPLTAQLVSSPSNGALTLAADGSFTYTPAAGFSGNDTFRYQASDGTLASNVATVTLAVSSGNVAPVAVADSYSVDEDQVLRVVEAAGVLANDTDADGDPLTASLVTSPSHGLITLNGNGSFVYIPNFDFFGTDTFTYTVRDALGASAHAVATITVNPVNDAPVGHTDTYSTLEDTALTVDAVFGLLGNDTDVEGDVLTAVLRSPPGHGTLTLNADGSFRYVPDQDFNGTDSFRYAANDGQADSPIVDVIINVVSVEDPPVIVLPAEFTDPLNIARRILGQTIEFTVVVLDPDDSDYVFQLDLESSGIPEGAAMPTIDLHTGRFVWTPTATGRFAIRVIVVNGERESDQETFLIDIVPP